MKEILSVGVILIEMVVMTLFGCVFNAFWDQLCGFLEIKSLLDSDVKIRVISLDKV